MRSTTTVLAALLSLAAPAAAYATTTAYDGNYAIDATTDEGDCVRAVKGQLSIEGGHIGTIGEPDIAATGLIDDGGTVSFVFRRGQEIVHAAGHMRGRAGNGSWSSNTSYCGGRWRAKRID